MVLYNKIIYIFFSLLFFIRRDSLSKTIFKYTLDGSAGMFKVAKMQKGSSNSLMIDHRKNLIYWTNIYTMSIEKIDFNGNHHKTYSTPEMYPFIIKLVRYYLNVKKNIITTIDV